MAPTHVGPFRSSQHTCSEPSWSSKNSRGSGTETCCVSVTWKNADLTSAAHATNLLLNAKPSTHLVVACPADGADNVAHELVLLGLSCDGSCPHLASNSMVSPPKRFYQRVPLLAQQVLYCTPHTLFELVQLFLPWLPSLHHQQSLHFSCLVHLGRHRF